MKIFGDKATTVRDTLKKIFESSGQKVLEASSSPPLLNAADKNEEKASPTAGKSSDDHNIQQQLTYIKEELSFMKSKLFTDTTKSCEGEEVKRLTDELEYLKDEVKEYKRTIRNLQQERENLICALNIVVEEQNHNRSSESRVPKSYDQGTSTIPQGSKQHDNTTTTTTTNTQTRMMNNLGLRLDQEDEIAILTATKIIQRQTRKQRKQRRGEINDLRLW